MDVADYAVLLVFVWYVHEGEFEEDLYYTHQLKHKQQARTFLDFRSVFINHQPDWNRCIDIRSDGLKLLKRMPKSLKCVLDNTVQIVNFIKAQPLYSRMFNLLCSDTGSEYENLIFRTKVHLALSW